MTLEIVQGLLHSSPWIVSSKCVEKLREVGEHTVVSYTVLQTLLPGTNTVGHCSDYVPRELFITLISVPATENKRARFTFFGRQINDRF